MSALLAYVRERFPLRIFVPAIAILAALSWSAAAAPVPALPGAVAVTALLVVQLRLWDDLEDVDRDRVFYPARVLTRSPLGPFQLVHAGLIAAAAVALASRPIALLAYVTWCLAMRAGYRRLRPHLPDGAWRYGVLLSKYPALVAIVALASGAVTLPRWAAAAAAAYLVAAGYEFHHSPARPPTRERLEPAR